MEFHRNFMTTFRADASWSSLYALQENVFMSICDDKDKNKNEGVYKMVKKEKELLDTFMYAMNTGLKKQFCINSLNCWKFYIRGSAATIN